MAPGLDVTEARTFSIVTPVYNPPEDAFRECVRSVTAQSYPYWEWCLANDCSTEPWVAPLLDELAALDSRIRVHHRAMNGGISAASNDALALATGDWIVLLDNDDTLDPDALGIVNHELALDDTIDFIYSDEDKIDRYGNYVEHFMKPKWSPERFLCQNYCCHLAAIRRDLVVEIGGFRSEFDGSQDYDLFLRATERARTIAHIPRVLYHWRVIAGSTSGDADAKPYAIDAGRRAVTDAMQRRGIDAVVKPGRGYHRVQRRLTSSPLVSIVIPTRGTVGQVWGQSVPYVVNIIDSIVQTSTYSNIEFVVVADKVMDRCTTDAVSSLGDNIRIVEFDEPFNFSKKCNLGAANARGEVLLFLNDDMEIKSPDWLESMLVFLDEPDVGIVGPMLLFDNFCVQSAGHVSAPLDHFGRGQAPTTPGGMGWPLALNRETMGVTGACMLMPRATFERLGGFSIEFPVNFNDVDLCFKVIDAGMRIVWTPDAELFHFESKTRNPLVRDAETELLNKLWGRLMRRDPYLPQTCDYLVGLELRPRGMFARRSGSNGRWTRRRGKEN